MHLNAKGLTPNVRQHSQNSNPADGSSLVIAPNCICLCVDVAIDLKGLKTGLSWCNNSHFQPSLITSDCQQLFLKVNSKWGDNSTLSSLVELIRQSLSLFPSASPKHILRTANIEAHVLAREALRHDEDCM
ncbi:hypothetical protein G4B88_027779 [Cannabis sativa]|uniref:RNase H type-1 domain-containing protein n=1 Tax=Cannabis sativa TaxID=3483 RepID=A0A7J6EHK6_CANSA|nr:hypothetical protein G4B88_027779 [Cannabis sativa]